MVWWVDKNESISSSCSENRVNNRYNIQEDRIFQSVNVMFNFAEEMTDPYNVYALIQNGVNTFNIDRTVIADSSYNIMKKTVNVAKTFPDMYHNVYFRPVCLSITMSITDVFTVDKDIDFVILKDVERDENITDFKKSNGVYDIPMLIWISEYNYNDVIDLVRASDGVLLDYSALDKKYCSDVIQACQMYRRLIFCLRSEISDDIHESYGSKRKLFVVASEVVNNGFHGTVINGTEVSFFEQRAIVQNIVEAMRVAEDQYDPNCHFVKLQKQIKIPQLVPMTVAVAATSAEITSGASAIIVITKSGETARLVSCSYPPCHILAITRSKWVACQMHLYRKVMPLVYTAPSEKCWHEECRNRVVFGTEFAVKTGLFHGGAKLVVLAPSEEGIGYCDSFQIVTVPFKCDE